MQHRMPSSGFFAVLRGIDTQRAVEVADVAVAAGFDMIEVTTNSPNPWSTLRRLSARHALEQAKS